MPRKNSLATLLPPIRKGPVEVPMSPDTARLLTSSPFTYKRSIAPSYVPARCVHVSCGKVARPTFRFSVPPLYTNTTGTPGASALLANSAYGKSPGISLATTVVQYVGTAPVGRTQASSVMPVVRSSELASATVTHDVVPSNDSPL